MIEGCLIYRIAQQFGVTSVDFNYETCQSPYIVKPADPGVQTGGSLVVALRSIDKAGNVYETQETVFQGKTTGTVQLDFTY